MPLALLFLAGPPLHALDGGGDERVEAHVLDLLRPLPVACELDEVADEGRQLLELADDVLGEPEDGDAPAS